MWYSLSAVVTGIFVIGIFMTEFVVIIIDIIVAIVLATVIVFAMAMDMIAKIWLLGRTSMGIAGPAVVL